MRPDQAPRADGSGDLARRYARALEGYLAGGGEEALRGAYEVGRSAIAGGEGLLALANAHQAALASTLRRSGPESLEEDLARAGEVLCECLSPYEMGLRGYQEAVLSLRRLNESMEREIQRIAHAVHDEAGQTLVAARLAMEDVARDLSPALQARLAGVGTILDRAEEGLRRLSHELRPTILDDLGLVAALQLLAEGIAARTGLRIDVSGPPRRRFPPPVETALYRITQEALRNVVRHARARVARVDVASRARQVRCAVADDGAGFDTEKVLSRGGGPGLGLLGIRERAEALGGTVEIRSAPGRGTRVRVAFPLEG